ncbi:MAG: GDSL-type esterase/lipase family protein [Phocaeicola sp.]
MKRALLVWVASYFALLPLWAQVKVACVGNSVTYGYLLENREKEAYPAQLQSLLGEGYQVGNFGHSGATLLKEGHRPYTSLEAYKNALAFKPDRVIIHLGLNDTDPRSWAAHRDSFLEDYSSLINAFKEVNPAAIISICRLSPIFHWHPRFQSSTRDWYHQVQHAIEQVARINQVELIDFQEVLYNRPDLMPDALHPNAQGAEMLAKRVYSAITGDFGGLQMSPAYSDYMVLQRNQALKVKGMAHAGAKVKVSFHKQSHKTVAASNGAWEVELTPLKAGGPYTLKIESDTQIIEYKEVLVGEVWLCSGQSNMFFRVDQSEEKEELLADVDQRSSIRILDRKPRWETYHVEWDSLTLHELNELNYFETTGWKAASTESVKGTTAIGYAFARKLNDSLQVPIGIIHCSLGGSPAEAWIDRATLEQEIPALLYNWKESDFLQAWVRGRASKNIAQATNRFQRHPYEPAYLYETAIQSLQDYPIAGVLWYQGESNAHNTELHEKLFPMLVDSWRRSWENPALPFLYVQLSSMNRPEWPLFRDSQRRLLDSRPHLGMAVSSDRGDSLDVHPRRKKEVGERLAAWALNQTYGRIALPSGPLYNHLRREKENIYVEFQYAEGLTTADGKAPCSFEVADERAIFHPAKAEIVGNEVRVWSPMVKSPLYVRYGWQPFTRANLVNAAGLPASTFLSAPY